MKFSLLVPHYGTPKMTAFTIAQLLKYKGDHEITIFIVDNNSGDGSLSYCSPMWAPNIWVYPYPKEQLQSHGIAFDFVMPFVQDEWVITLESDSFPTKPDWLDYYEDLINKGYDGAGSLLKLSGGEYIHPAGALYKKSIWQEAKAYCKSIKYAYFPNMSMKEGFACHLMVHSNILQDFLSSPNDYIELSTSYLPYTNSLAAEKRYYYEPVNAPFHNGMGKNQESIHTYGIRNLESEAENVLLDNKYKLINRIGAEPGQWFSWWQKAMGKSIFQIPTEVKWIEGREGRQQEYTLMENGFRHIWGVSAYKDVDPNDEIAKIKQCIPEELYETLPEHQKIKDGSN